MQLGLNGYGRLIDELELRLAVFCENLDHHIVELLSVHGFKDLVLHMPSGLPQTCWNVHLAHAIPVESQA